MKSTKRIIIAVVFATLLLFQGSVFGAPQPASPVQYDQSSEIRQLDKSIKSAIAKNNVQPDKLDEINAKAGILVDVNTGKILFEQNADKKLYPASTTKLMTMVITLEAVNRGKVSLDDMVTISKNAADVEGSQAHFVAGDKVPLRDLLVAAAVVSGNDAAVAMSEYIGTNQAKFVEIMNAKAKSIGMTNTHFMNPHGLHNEQHYSTARDMATLGKYAIGVNGLLGFTSIKEYNLNVHGEKVLVKSTNRLLNWYAGTDGLKTGSTTPAGRNLVATAKRDGFRLLSVAMGCSEKDSHMIESMKMLNYGFNNYKYYIDKRKDQDVVIIDVKKGITKEVVLVAKDNLDATYKKSNSFDKKVVFDLPDYIMAPIKAGQEIGTATLYINDKAMSKVTLVAKEAVNRASYLASIADMFKQVFTL